MEQLKLLLQTHQLLLASLSSVLVSLLVLYFWWQEIRYWLHTLWCSLPLVGRVSSLSRQLDKRDRQGWYPAERELCASYYRFYQQQSLSAGFFDLCRDYLNKAQETGRMSLPIFAWLLLIAMVVVEALGFSYVLAGYTIPGASEQLQQYGAGGIAFLISVILVYFTHSAGQEMHKNRLVGKIRSWYNADANAQDLLPDNSISLETSFNDHSQKAYRQLLNRIDTNAQVRPSYWVTLLTLLFVCLVAVGATYVRGKVLEQQMIEQTTGQQNSPFTDLSQTESLPAELLSQKQSADQQAMDEQQQADYQAGWGTFIVLAVIFVFLQLLGILVGFKTGFAGKESANARRYIGRFRSRDEFAQHYDRKRQQVISDAQQHLRQLQNRIRHKVTRESIAAHQHQANDPHFEDYIELCRQRSVTGESALAATQSVTRSSNSVPTAAPIASSDSAASAQTQTLVVDKTRLALLAQLSPTQRQAFDSMTAEQQDLFLSLQTGNSQ